MYAHLLERLASLEKEGATPSEARALLSLSIHFAEKEFPRLSREFGWLTFTLELRLRKTSENEVFGKRFETCGHKLKERVENLSAEISQWCTAEMTGAAGLVPRILALKTWHKMTGVEFENFIIDRLWQQGFQALGTRATGDEGIDIIARWQGSDPRENMLIASPIPGRKYLIQCKRYGAQQTIGQPILREFYGSIMGADTSAEGILITTSQFSEPAISYARRMGIRLIDGETLDTLLSQSSRLTQR